MVTVFKWVDEAVLGWLPEQRRAIYARLGGRAFTPNFGFKPPTALTRATSEGNTTQLKSDLVPFGDVPTAFGVGQ